MLPFDPLPVFIFHLANKSVSGKLLIFGSSEKQNLQKKETTQLWWHFKQMQQICQVYLIFFCFLFLFKVHKKDKKYKCMVCKKIFMLAASVGIRHGSRRYGVCVDCADKSQPGGQEGVDQVQDTDFPRDEEYEENEVGEADEELGDDVEEQNDPSRWDESAEVCMPLDD